MDPSSSIPSLLFTILLTLIISAFFSGMEIAFVSANRLKIQLDSRKKSFSGKMLANFVKHDSHFIATMLLGNNAAIVIYSISMAKLLEPGIMSIVGDYSGLVLLIQTLISTLIILTLSEFLPKAIFQINPNRILKLLFYPLLLLYVLLYPFTKLTVMITRQIMRLFNVDIEEKAPAFSKIDLDYYVNDINDRMEEESELDNEVEFLKNALRFGEVKARDCMIPRTDIEAIEIESSIEELKNKFIETGLSKILIYRDSIDNIIGYAHSFELFNKPQKITDCLIPISYVPEAILAKDLLELFTKQQGNLAIVVDEFGGTSGLVTIEDILEEIFGDIEDEHDLEVLLEEQIDENTYLFSARLEVDYLNEEYHLSLEESPEYETLGGLVLHYLESIPEEGDVLRLEKFNLKIQAVSDRKIEAIILERIEKL